MCDVVCAEGDRLVIVGSYQMCDVGRYIIDRIVVEALIKTSVRGNFDSCGFGIVPHDVSCGVWYIT